MSGSRQAAGDTAPFEECIRQMDSLADELRSGMAAIRANSPERFAASVGRQRLLAEALGNAAAGSAARREETKPWPERFRVAARSLRSLNQEYAALIEHSGRSLRLLAQLQRLEAGRAPGPEAVHGSLSVNA